MSTAPFAPTARLRAAGERTGVPEQRTPDLDERGEPVFYDIPRYTENRRELGWLLGFEIDLFGREARARAAGRALIDAAEEQRSAARLLVAREVVVAYVEWSAAQAQANLLDQRLALAERELEDMQAKRDLGLATREDSDSAQELLRDVQREVQELRRARAHAHGRLAMLLGTDAASLRLNAAVVPTGSLQVAPDLPASVLARRPDVQSAWHEIEASRIAVEQARLQRFPQINLTASIGFASNALGGFIDRDHRTWMMGPAFEWLPLDGGRVRGEVAMARADHATAIGHYRKIMLTALHEVETALADWQAAVESEALSAATEERARRHLTDIQANAAIGLADGAAVREAERELVAAQLARLGRRTDLWRAYAALNTALGHRNE